jgi:hypothetical protein
VQDLDRSAAPAPPPGVPFPQRPGAGTVLTLVNGVLAGIAATYATTHSVLITIIEPTQNGALGYSRVEEYKQCGDPLLGLVYVRQ